MNDYKTAERPEWLRELCRLGGYSNLTGADIAAINEVGCESGAFLPAVTDVHALTVMGTHGNEILDFIKAHSGKTLEQIAAFPAAGSFSWDGLACAICALAVDSWCAQFEGDWEDDG